MNVDTKQVARTMSAATIIWCLWLAAILIAASACRTGDTRPTYRTCAEAEAAGAAPIPRENPAYRLMWDYDNDGLACEKGQP